MVIVMWETWKHIIKEIRERENAPARAKEVYCAGTMLPHLCMKRPSLPHTLFFTGISI